jgi:hypothetical protein
MPLQRDIVLTLGAIDCLEKYAAEANDETSYEALLQVAKFSHMLFDEIMAAGAGVKEAAELLPPEIAAVKLAAVAVETAAHVDPETIVKLAAVAYVDNVLTAEIEKTGAESAVRCRALGREYATHLLRNLI